MILTHVGKCFSNYSDRFLISKRDTCKLIRKDNKDNYYSHDPLGLPDLREKDKFPHYIYIGINMFSGGYMLCKVCGYKEDETYYLIPYSYDAADNIMSDTNRVGESKYRLRWKGI